MPDKRPRREATRKASRSPAPRERQEREKRTGGRSNSWLTALHKARVKLNIWRFGVKKGSKLYNLALDYQAQIEGRATRARRRRSPSRSRSRSRSSSRAKPRPRRRARQGGDSKTAPKTAAPASAKPAASAAVSASGAATTSAKRMHKAGGDSEALRKRIPNALKELDIQADDRERKVRGLQAQLKEARLLLSVSKDDMRVLSEYFGNPTKEMESDVERIVTHAENIRI